GGVDLTFREPLGVVGLIVPWNFPLNIASWKLGPALACGNTVVLKPAELTPLSALRLAELALEAGIPEGVINVIVGKGSVDGETLFRGEAPAGAGFWYPCTLVEASNDDRIAREEVFGPVAALIPFDDEADAIRIANDTPYGLSGSIWTRDGARALRVVRALETGVLSVNSNSSVRVSTPFGGFKQSGFGRELGMQALEGYSEVKNVFYSTEG